MCYRGSFKCGATVAYGRWMLLSICCGAELCEATPVAFLAVLGAVPGSHHRAWVQQDAALQGPLQLHVPGAPLLPHSNAPPAHMFYGCSPY